MRSRIYLSNATTTRGLSGKLTYGIPLAYRLAKKYKLAGVELLLSWFPWTQGWRNHLSNLELALHLPWSYRFDPWGWNHEASISANIVGKAAYLSQAGTGRVLKIGEILELKYQVIHPGAFAKCLPIPLTELKAIKNLAFENDWNPLGYKGIEAAIRFADLAEGRIVVDITHMARVPEDASCAIKMIDAIGDRLVAVHVSDYDEMLGEHLVPIWGQERYKNLPRILDRVRSWNPGAAMVGEILKGDPEEDVEGLIAYVEH